MKKGILCILLSLLLLAPMFASCTQEADLTGTAATIYTFYTIVDDDTTPEAIRQVELALNRIMYYRLGVILDLQMVKESEYDEFIENKFAEMEEYQANKQSAALTEETSATGEVVTGDDILDMLENGQDIPSSVPRLDIFLVQGYDKYYEIALSGKVLALDTALANEGKALTTSIHSTLFQAAKVNGMTYGVPANNAIGQYKYLVFDKELLNKYSTNHNTLKTLKDLEGYLAVIAENEQGVVPLANTTPSADIDFLVRDGFPAVIENGTVKNAYESFAVTEYLAMIARYNALGYLGDVDENAISSSFIRSAVRIEEGTIEEISKRLESTGYEYEYSLYSAPVATNESAFENIFCISKYVVTNELSIIMEILKTINSDAQIMNLLTYGIENEHYILNENGQVERLNNDYSADAQRIGNCFLTYTVDGEDANKWDNYIKQNQDAVISPSLGFTFNPDKFGYVADGVYTSVSEPDYFAIINEVVDKYYPDLMNGTAVEFDFEELLATATKTVEDEIVAELDKMYISKLDATYIASLKEKVIEQKGEALREESTTTMTANYLAAARMDIETDLTEQYTAENPTASADDIAAMVAETATDEYVAEHLYEYYPEEEIKAGIEADYNNKINTEVNDRLTTIKASSEYKGKLNGIRNSTAYKTAYNSKMEYDAPASITKEVDEIIAELFGAYTDEMISEMNVAIKAAVEAFTAENAEKLELTEYEMLVTIGYLTEEEVATDESTDGETSEGETSEEEPVEGEGEADVEDYPAPYKPAYESWFDFVFQEKIVNAYAVLIA